MFPGGGHDPMFTQMATTMIAYVPSHIIINIKGSNMQCDNGSDSCSNIIYVSGSCFCYNNNTLRWKKLIL